MESKAQRKDGRKWSAKRDGNLPRDHACRWQQQCQAQLIRIIGSSPPNRGRPSDELEAYLLQTGAANSKECCRLFKVRNSIASVSLTRGQTDNVRVGSKPAVSATENHFRLALTSGPMACILDRQLRDKSGIIRCNQSRVDDAGPPLTRSPHRTRLITLLPRPNQWARPACAAREPQRESRSPRSAHSRPSRIIQPRSCRYCP